MPTMVLKLFTGRTKRQLYASTFGEHKKLPQGTTRLKLRVKSQWLSPLIFVGSGLSSFFHHYNCFKFRKFWFII